MESEPLVSFSMRRTYDLLVVFFHLAWRSTFQRAMWTFHIVKFYVGANASLKIWFRCVVFPV